MTLRQFAAAIRADEKWVQNAARLLGRPLRYTVEEARWLGVGRLLHASFGIPLSNAARMASVALAAPPTDRAACIAASTEGPDGATAAGRSGADPDGADAFVMIDLARYHTGFAASLSAALVHATPRRRGRRPAALGQAADEADGSLPRRDPRRVLDLASAYGVDLGLLRAALARTPAERLALLDENAEFLAAARRAPKRRAVAAPTPAPTRRPGDSRVP